MNCPRCDSEHTVKHGRIHTGQAKRLGKHCRRPFVPDATKKVITLQTWELLDTRLLEKLPLAGIARVAGLSEDDLQAYVHRTYAAVPRESQGRAKKQAG